MNKLIYLFLSLISFFSITCSDSSQLNMRTGFYFLENGPNTVKMKKERTNEIYSLSKPPFASVYDIKETELRTTKLSQGDYTELCMLFNRKGTKDLEEGTGNSLHPKIAVVMADNLLYVVDNTTKITTGVMCVGLDNYSESEIQAIKKAVDQKK